MYTFSRALSGATLIAVTAPAALAQDGFTFTAQSPLNGIVAHDLTGHTVPTTYQAPLALTSQYKLSSLDLVKAGALPGQVGAKAALTVTATGSDLSGYSAALAASAYASEAFTLRFGTLDLGADVSGTDYTFGGGSMETRYYGAHTGQIYTFYLGAHALITGPMPTVELTIQYNDPLDPLDDVLGLVSEYAPAADATDGSTPTEVRDLATALLADIGGRGIRIRYDDLSPEQLPLDFSLGNGLALVSTRGYVDLSPTDLDATAAAESPSAGTPNGCVAATNTVNSTGAGGWLHLRDGANDRIASIYDSEALGPIVGSVYVNSGTVRSDVDGREWLDRNVVITPTVQPTSPVRVRLYFTDNEWSDYLAANDGDASDGKTIRELWVRKFATDVCESAASGAYTDLRVLDHGRINGGHFAEVEVASFSNFYMGGDGESAAMPVTWTGFAAERLSSGAVDLAWSTGSEIDADRFEVERSGDGEHFAAVGEVLARGTAADYAFVDAEAPVGVLYYRLRQLDLDGTADYSATVAVGADDRSDTRDLTATPNPASPGASVRLLGAATAGRPYVLVDLAGATVRTGADASVGVDTEGLAPGAYVLRCGGAATPLLLR